MFIVNNTDTRMTKLTGLQRTWFPLETLSNVNLIAFWLLNLVFNNKNMYNLFDWFSTGFSLENKRRSNFENYEYLVDG